MGAGSEVRQARCQGQKSHIVVSLRPDAMAAALTPIDGTKIKRMTSAGAARLYVPTAIGLALWIVLHAAWSNELYSRHFSKQSPTERGDIVLKRIGQVLSLGLYSGAAADEQEVDALAQYAEAYSRRAALGAIILAAVSAGYLFLAWRRAQGNRRNALALALLIVAAVFLCIGLVAPVLNLVASRDVPLLGHVVLKHESKAILGTVWMLLQTGNVFLSLLLGVFSIIMPMIKMLIAFFALSRFGAKSHERLEVWMHRLAPWSMTDVFVVAMLIALFAAGADGDTDAWPGLGLYFFSAYVILSVLAGQIAGSPVDSLEKTLDGAAKQ